MHLFQSSVQLMCLLMELTVVYTRRSQLIASYTATSSMQQGFVTKLLYVYIQEISCGQMAHTELVRKMTLPFIESH